MSRVLNEIALVIIALALLMSLLQTERIWYYYQTLFLFKIYFWVSIGLILLAVFLWLKRYWGKQSVFSFIHQKFKSLPIPKGAKYLIVIAFVGNLLAIAWGAQRYPFYDVGMFRYPVDFVERDKVFYELKYYFWEKGQHHILELRKECSFFLSDHLGWGYSHDFAYATAYFHKGEKENFQFLSQLMKERGVDTLWVGVHSVNFETREVAFDPDICQAIKINQSGKLYYGPIYIPGYQMALCDED